MLRACDQVLSGTCAWFSVEKGFGFITIDGTEMDVFVHNKDVHAERFRSLAEGEKLEFKRQIDERGRVCAVEVTGPGGTFVQGAAERQEATLEASDKLLTGKCKWFDDEKGFGFIRVDGEEETDLFVHFNDIYAQGYRSLAEGEQVQFYCTLDSNGRPKAKRVTGPDGAYVQGARRTEAAAQREWSEKWDAAGWELAEDFGYDAD